MSGSAPARRSCLSVPATQPRFIEKATEVPADELIFDLEDSVAPAAKETARALVVAALTGRRYPAGVKAVRVNAVGTRWCLDDVREVVEGAGSSLDTVVVPKVEDPGQVHSIEHLLDKLERTQGLERRIGLELQIESARGLENVGAIAASSGRIRALHFGPGDFAASLGMPLLTIGVQSRGYPGDLMHYFLARILVAARAHGLQAIDGPYAQVRDQAGLRESAQRAAALGYDGKWALNPAQVDVVNEVFTPRQEDFERASAIVEAYARATDLDQAGAVMLGEEMIDEASRKMAEVTVARGRAAGLRPARG